MAVGIILNRTATVILDGVELLWHLQLHAELEHLCHLGVLGGSEVLVYKYCSVSLQSVGHGKFALHVVHLDVGLHHMAVSHCLMAY